MDRFIRLITILVFLSLASLALGQDAKLIEAAKKEGRVVIYGGLETETVDVLQKTFEKKTGIEMQWWRASSTKVMDRVLTEHRTGKPIFDVVLGTTAAMEILSKEGILGKYESPSAAGFPKSAIHLDLGPRYRNVIIGVVYNKGMIKPSDAPKSFEDLLKPQFKGKLAMPDPTQHTTTTQWLASLQKIMGKEKADKFIQDLAATRPMLVESLLPAGERVSTGEMSIAITYVKYAYIYSQKGAALDYVRLPKMLGEGHYIALSNKAPRPNAGKVFIDHFLNDESMSIMAKMGEFVNRKGIYPPLPDADKIEFVGMVDLDQKGFAEKKAAYRKIFLH